MKPFPQSRCHACAFVREVVTARSVFLMCTEPSLPKYAPQPVVSCAAFQPAQADSPKPSET